LSGKSTRKGQAGGFPAATQRPSRSLCRVLAHSSSIQFDMPHHSLRGSLRFIPKRVKQAIRKADARKNGFLEMLKLL